MHASRDPQHLKTWPYALWSAGPWLTTAGVRKQTPRGTIQVGLHPKIWLSRVKDHQSRNKQNLSKGLRPPFLKSAIIRVTFRAGRRETGRKTLTPTRIQSVTAGI